MKSGSLLLPALLVLSTQLRAHSLHSEHTDADFKFRHLEFDVAEHKRHFSMSLHVGTAAKTCTVLDSSESETQHRLLLRYPFPKAVVAERRPAQTMPDHTPTTNRIETMFVKIIGVDASAVYTLAADTLCENGLTHEQPAVLPLAMKKPVVRQIIASGPSTNRIDVTFMGDGYTKEQKELFFTDMQRLTKDMWDGGAFDGVLPLMNVWAVFVESQESGIGVGGAPRDTAFGLFRDGTELRGVYPSRPEVARAVCKAPGPGTCDFPALIANDPYYGGLGGEFTIGTASLTTGTVVLRHEFGHTMINTGEEYDGGEAYFGCNAAMSLKNIKWKQWLTEGAKGLKEQKNAIRVQDYSWYDLAQGPYHLNFTSDGKYDRWFLRITASGVELPDSLQVTLDGKPLNWTSHGNFDRGFHEWIDKTGGFEKGLHHLEFRQGFPPSAESAPIRQLCSVTLHEYAAEEAYHFDPEYIGAFPTYSLSGKKSYRPTHESCLMRNMTSPIFCPVCKEGLFLELLKRITLIDSIDTSCTNKRSDSAPLQLQEYEGMDMQVAKDNDKSRSRKAKVNLLKLAHLRPEGKRIPGEKYYINWSRNGVVQKQFNNMEEIVVAGGCAAVSGDWEVSVKIVTPLVRSDPDELTISRGRFVWTAC